LVALRVMIEFAVCCCRWVLVRVIQCWCGLSSRKCQLKELC